MKKIIIILFSVVLNLCLYSQVPNEKIEYIKKIYELSKEGSPVYFTINLFYKGKNYKVLLQNRHIYSEQYGYLDFYKQFPDTLLVLLQQGIWIPTDSVKGFKNYNVDTTIYARLKQSKTPVEVYNQYFDKIKIAKNNKIGIPKYKKYPIEEIRAAVAYLIDYYVIVRQNSSFQHAIYDFPNRRWWKTVARKSSE